MNLKIIQTPNYILGVDKEAEPKNGEIGLSTAIIEDSPDYLIFKMLELNHSKKEKSIFLGECVNDEGKFNGGKFTEGKGNMCKIIAHIPLNGKEPLEGVWLLPDYEEEKEDKLVELSMTSHGLGDTYEGRCFESGFQLGYKTAGGYTEEDMRTIFGLGAANHANGKPSFEEAIKSLKPHPIEFEVEMEWVNNGDDNYDEGGTLIGSVESYQQPKILNNIIQGKFIWKQLN